FFEDIVGWVIDAAEAKRWPGLVALRGVVKNHIQNDLDTGSVERLDHVPKFVHWPKRVLPRAVCLVRREKRDRRIAPVIDLSRRAILGIELEHRQQFHGRNAKLLKKRNLLNQAGKGTSCLFTESRTGMAGKTANVHFINDGAGRGQ